MEYLIRFAHTHESFRRAELEVLARMEGNGVGIEIIEYHADSPFVVVRIVLSSSSTTATEDVNDVARSLISRSILSRGVYELWGRGVTYEQLHADVRTHGSRLWEPYMQTSFRFSFDTFCGKRSSDKQKQIINSFSYLGLKGKISMKNAEVEFTVFEQWDAPHAEKEFDHDSTRKTEIQGGATPATQEPRRMFFGRLVGGSRRHLVDKHDLKRRPYISTTSMDAELALLTARFALAGPGKVFLDPFVGTGGFMVAASELGSLTFGADIDGRSFRGKGPGTARGVDLNFRKYGLTSLFGNCFISDLTNTPLRLQGPGADKLTRWIDGIIADPPYGIREGLKVLGTRSLKDTDAVVTGNGKGVTAVKEPHYIDGVPAHTREGYIPPKKQYSFIRMLDDILDFAARTLVDNGRLAFWMPSANELDEELVLPSHPLLELKHVCVQSFNKWSRRLLVFERIPGDVPRDFDLSFKQNGSETSDIKPYANDLNAFRKMYFQGFNANPP